VSVHPTAILNHPPMHRDFRDRQLDWFSPQIDPLCRVEAFVIVEYGIYRPTVVGASWLMLYAHVGHDVIVGDRCEITARTTIAAHCEIGNDVRLGLGTVTRPGVRIGDGARTGCGAVVVRDIPAGETWVGNPARPLRRDERILDPQGSDDGTVTMIHGPRLIRG
jgi:acetyltransferase-like isoleucine patch superfamily enzyme